jgi:membrane fusion protein, copper/silver efflux system
MNRRHLIVALALALLLGATGYGLYVLGLRQGATHAQPAAAAPQGRKVLYWQDPMVPGQRFDKPGKSPYMDMDLVPVYEGEAQGQGVLVAPGVRQNLGIRLAEVRRASLAPAVQAVGSVAFDEREAVYIQARSSGYVEHLLVRAPFDPVRKGQALVQVYVPDWVAAQEDYLALKRMPAAAAGPELQDAALQRMRLAGMSEEQVRQVVAHGSVHPRMAIVAPADGVVSELSVREGMTVAPGTPLFRINGLRTVWLDADLPESLAARVRPGTRVEATTPAFPGQEFSGKVEAILPEVNRETRTLKVRIVLANPGRKLVPGMFATVRVADGPAAADQLLVPSEAVIQTGERSVVIVALPGGGFTPAEIVTGAEANGQTEVVRGLEAGQKVVASGQFLIDSEASLRGTLRRLEPPQAARPAAPASHQAVGRIEKIDPDSVTISHGPIPSLNWGPMTMGFAPPAGGMPASIHVGDQVRFAIAPGAKGFRIVSIVRTAPPAAPASAEAGHHMHGDER